ncbi:MAG TPA: four helix bundle protein [Candidatus Didemnitutus sp.]|nr:four helix bundle protein [Candidatus Didemnitutus sp.]
MSETLSAKPHKRLLAWQRSMALFVEIHRLTARMPSSERYLVDQLRRAALSAPSNIAEGAADPSPDQFRSFLCYAIRSLNEVDTQLEAACRTGLVDKVDAARLAELLDECLRLTFGLRRSVVSKKRESLALASRHPSA